MSSLIKVIRHGFVFFELPPSTRPPEDDLPPAARDIEIGAEGLARMRHAHAGKAWGGKPKHEKKK